MAGTAPEGQEFRMNAEIEIENLKELHHVLSDVHEQSFRNHVSEKKNDFASWVRHSVKDYELADKLEKTFDFEETKDIIRKRVEELEEKERKERESISEQHKFEDKLDEQKDDPFAGKDLFGLELDKIDVPPEPPQEDIYKATPKVEDKPTGLTWNKATPKVEDKPIRLTWNKAQETGPRQAPPEVAAAFSNMPKAEQTEDKNAKETEQKDAKPILPQIPKLAILEMKPEMHPAEKVKHSLRSVIFGFLLGLLSGLAIGYLLGINNVFG